MYEDSIIITPFPMRKGREIKYLQKDRTKKWSLKELP